MVVAIIVIGVLLLIGLIYILIRNSIIGSRNRVDEAWSGIDVQLKRRHDLVPNLVETVRGYATHERETFEKVTQARAAAMQAQGPAEASQAEGLLTQLQQGLRHEAGQGRTVALIIDEAQDLPLETLEQLPLLANLTPASEPPLQIVLVGQPELRQHLRRRGLRRLAQHGFSHATLMPLTEAESLTYIRQRVAKVALPGGPIFTQGALEAIVRHTHGVPHDVNLLCTNVLLAGFWAQQ